MSTRLEKQASHPFSRRLSSVEQRHKLPVHEGSARNRAEIGEIATVRQVASIRVLLMCDHPIEREGIRLIIEGQPGMTVVADTNGNLEEQGGLVKQADIILLDIDSDSRSGLAHLPRVVEMAGRGRVIALTNPCKQDLCHHLAQLGAMGVVSKNQAVDILVMAIKKVHSGEIWFDRTTMADLIRHLAQPIRRPCDDEAALKISTLTKREREVIQLLGQGLNANTLAKRLFISEITVRHHLSSILAKLSVRDRFELVFYAYRHRLAVPPTYQSVNDPTS